MSFLVARFLLLSPRALELVPKQGAVFMELELAEATGLSSSLQKIISPVLLGFLYVFGV